jgi:hypothetical protein
VAGDQRVALCANSSTAAGKVPSTARGRPRAAGAALRPAGQELAARLSGHCDSAQAGAFSQVGEFGVGVEMAVARARARVITLFGTCPRTLRAIHRVAWGVLSTSLR